MASSPCARWPASMPCSPAPRSWRWGGGCSARVRRCGQRLRSPSRPSCLPTRAGATHTHSWPSSACCACRPPGATPARLWMAMAGLFLVPARGGGFVFGLVAALALVVLKARDIGLSLHTAVPLLPLLALGVGMALHTALRRLYVWSIGWLAPVWLAAQPCLRALPMHAVKHAGGAPSLPAEPLNEPTAPRAGRPAPPPIAFLVVGSPVGLSLARDAA